MACILRDDSDIAILIKKKAFDCVPRSVTWWALRRLNIEERQILYEECVCCNLREEFSVKVEVHQGSCLSPLLFITLMEALYQEFHTENLYADDLVIIIESLEEPQEKLILWKSSMEGKVLRVNVGKTKVLPDIWARAWCASDVKQRPLCCMSQGPHSLFSIFYQKCSGIPGPLKPDSSFRCKWCTAQAWPIDGRPMIELTLGCWEKLEVVPSFCYLGLLSAYPQVAVVNLLLSQSAMSHRANSMGSCPSSPHFSSPPEEEFTIHASGVLCSMQTKPRPKPYVICNALIELWFAGCAVSPPRT